jgi:hypothetical protein
LLNFYNDHKTGITFWSGVLLGLVLGLLVGWVIWPTGYYNATPAMLRQDFRDEYLVWVAKDYAATGNLEQAQQRLGVAFWEKDTLKAALEDLAQRRGGEDAQYLMRLAQDLPEAPPAERESLVERLRPVFLVCGAGLILLGLVGLAYFGLQRIRGREHLPSERAIASREVETTRWVGEEAPPLAQYVTTYTLGDDYYDPSFSIETETGDFLGECGVGISETIGVGDPKKVTALEVWLFDKNDIRTVTKVLMSEYAFHDEALRASLASKGDLVLVEPGTEVVLETATLTLRARVTELQYGVGQLPDNSFFQRVTLELGVWTKPGAEGEEVTLQ